MTQPGSPYLDPNMARYYATVSGPIQFEQPARDLVSFLRVSPGDKFLDVGSGSGLIAGAAMDAIGDSAIVVAVDSSIVMLGQQRNHEVRRVVASAQDLPFEPNLFDCIAAGFVITHLPDYRRGLQSWMRVLRPGGTIAATTWAAGSTIASEIWKTMLKKYVQPAIVEKEFAAIIPSDEFFSVRANLVTAFHESGFIHLRDETKTYLVAMPVERFIDTKIGSVEGTIVRRSIGAEAWKRFVDELSHLLRDKFPERMEYARAVHFVSGQKPQ